MHLIHLEQPPIALCSQTLSVLFLLSVRAYKVITVRN